MNKSIIIFVLLLTTILAVRSEFKHVSNKSGDIVIQTSKSNSQLFLKGNVFQNTKLQSIQDVEISNLISHVMGLLPLNNEQSSRSSFPAVSVFNKPKLNLLFTLNSISKESLKDFTFFEGNNGINIEKSYFPMDSVAELATIATGVTPESHGIVSESWIVGNDKVPAYEKKSQSLNANVADVMSQSFNGKSLIISTSASKKFTSALSLHSKISNKNAYGFYSSKGGVSIETVNSPNAEALSKLILTPAQIESTLYSKEFKEFILPSSDWSVSMKSGVLHITSDNGKTLFFNLDATIDNAFLTELVMLFHTVQQVKSNPHFHKLAIDSVPDMMSFSFSTPIESSFSQDIYRVAIAMINNAMSNAYSQLSTLYGRVACEVVALSPVQHDKEVLEKVSEALDNVAHDIKESFPHVYLKPAHKASIVRLCDEVQQAVQDHKVHCVHTFAHYNVVDGNVPNGTSSDSSSSNENDLQASANTNQIAAFQIFLFFPIFWVLFIVGGALLIMKISFDAQKDTLLYRNTERQY